MKANKKILLLPVILLTLLLCSCGKNTIDTTSNGQNTAASTTSSEETTYYDYGYASLIQQKNYGRILFVGDSRTVDMFIATVHDVSGINADGITVYAMDGGGYDYLVETIDAYGMDNFDTLITWLGANDAGNFTPYIGYYNGILENGKRLILCNVGPTDDEHLLDVCIPDYLNEKMLQYNQAQAEWAAEHDIKVIDLYTFVSENIGIEEVDGVHYEPKPTTTVWDEIMNNI
ncbi:Lysophospholipase L1 [Butyrivibrio hungatei DSM 14810]|uniref:Lysophospholipase L1 n=1 Tax=Butyrivibrio hungatei DSM 14810 TaxID=1121132 RepID=A0A1M7T4Z2_9FIRM|nr:hypothetical protein [Butyrivibrio hungatei]SHN65761.1 Lysophospholipase L1 [Butyrivibrio hungatei DSM 14810]